MNALRPFIRTPTRESIPINNCIECCWRGYLALISGLGILTIILVCDAVLHLQTPRIYRSVLRWSRHSRCTPRTRQASGILRRSHWRLLYSGCSRMLRQLVNLSCRRRWRSREFFSTFEVRVPHSELDISSAWNFHRTITKTGFAFGHAITL